MIRTLTVLLASTALTAQAWADTVVPMPAVATVTPPMQIDLTQIVIATIGGIFLIINGVFAAWIQSHIKDQAAAANLATAVKNSLGAIQIAADQGVTTAHPGILLPAGTPPSMAVGVQYVLDHAGDDANRLGVDTPMIISKINAQLGLQNIATNIATASSQAPSPRPLAPLQGPPPTPVVAVTGTTGATGTLPP